MKPSRPIVAALILTTLFCVSFWIMWNQRKSEERTVSNTESGVSAEAAADAGVTPTIEQSNLAPSPAEAVAAPSRDTAPLPPKPTVDSTAEDLPVTLHFRNRPDLGKIQGSIINNSANPMVIDAVISSPTTGETTQSQISVVPYGGTPFGLDDGLDMRSGDQITLKSSPYRDKLGKIP